MQGNKLKIEVVDVNSKQIENTNKRKDKLTMSFSNQSTKKEDFEKRNIAKKTHKSYTIDGITVVALNEKNAIRKAGKIKNNK